MSERQHSQFYLLSQTRFLPFYLTQFFGALNDNLFKNALVMWLSYHVTQLYGFSLEGMVNVIFALFVLPFFLFSALAGQLADKYEKARLIQFIKIAEIGIMLCALFGLYFENLPCLLLTLFLLGVQTTFFGPVKYSILPQHLGKQELVGANGLVEMGTFVAILLGTLLGGILIASFAQGRMLVAGLIVLVSIVGYLTSRAIPTAAPSNPHLKIDYNLWRTTWQNINFAKQSRSVFKAILGVSWFWFYGAFCLAQLTPFVKHVLAGNEQVATCLLVVFSVGIGAGSLICEKLSGRVIEIGLVPLGSIGLSLFAIDLYFASNVQLSMQTLASVWQHAANYRVLCDCFAIGFFGGIYVVPLYTLIQARGDQTRLSRIISANNILNALFMVLAALFAMTLLKFGISIRGLYLSIGLLNVIIAAYIYLLMPEFVMRFIIWIWISMLYRVNVKGMQNIPATGAAVLICNHISFIDALIITAYCRRPIRFVMDHGIFRIPVLNFIFRTAKAIPVASARENPAIKKQAFIDVANALESGELVAIFPEGAISHDGEMQAFRPGIEQIINTTPVPVIPLALRGLWGSFFSRKYGRAMSRLPRRLFYNIELVAGEAIAPEKVERNYLHDVVRALRGDCK